MKAWLKPLVLIASSSVGISGCSQPAVLKPEQIRLNQPISTFKGSPKFKVTFESDGSCQLQGKFDNETVYYVYCSGGESQAITAVPSKNRTFSRDEAVKIVHQLLPRPEMRMNEADSEDLEKRDAEILCEHLYFEGGPYADLYYATKSTCRISKIEVYSLRQPT